MIVLKAKQSLLTMQYSVITTSPLYLYKAGHGPTDFLNCVNAGTQDEKLEIMILRDCLPCTFIPLMIADYINLPWQFSPTAVRNFFMNLTSVIRTSSATFS